MMKDSVRWGGTPRFRKERCKNPWDGRCGRDDIALYIFYNGERVPICRRCWSRIANRNIEWGEDLEKIKR